MSALTSAIDGAYEVFAGYSDCQLDIDAGLPQYCDNRPLRLPVRTIPASAFRWYQIKAISTWGTAADFKHLLPRMLELTVEHIIAAPNDLDPFHLGGLLLRANWSEWPRKETDAVELVLFQHLLG